MDNTKPAGEDILRVEHVSNYYSDNGLGILRNRKRSQVLQDVSLTIGKDEFFGLVGESGCGKSTLGNAILGLIPYEGKITVAGLEYGKVSRKEFTRHIQAVFQDPLSAMNPRRTIGDTMKEPLMAHGIGTPEEQEAAVRAMLETVGLDASYADRYPRELSGGQRQRVCIGAALMLEPELIIADEAISALDVSVGSQILNLFRTIDVERDFSMLFISHNLNVVYYLCDRIAVMYKGSIVEMGTADAVYNDPMHPYTRLLLSAIPDYASEDDGDRALLERFRSPVEGSCAFYHRCPHATDKCKKVPELRNKAYRGEEEHLVRCFYL
jgi:oligopeptide/dipeptide ABC transporter ATP-binding protein